MRKMVPVVSRVLFQGVRHVEDGSCGKQSVVPRRQTCGRWFLWLAECCSKASDMWKMVPVVSRVLFQGIRHVEDGSCGKQSVVPRGQTCGRWFLW